MSAVMPESLTSMRCAIGWHDPEPVARWNDGYYFARCRRCARDLVRTAYGRWHIPRGARVVWSPHRPENSLSAVLAPLPVEAPETPSPPDDGELPIQEVLRHLQGGPERTSGGPAGPGRPGRTYIPDFMEDAGTDTSWRTNRPANWPPPAVAGEAGRASGPESPADSGARRTAAARLVTIAAGGLALLFLFVALAGSGWPTGPGRGAQAPAQTGMTSGGPDVFVTATETECRDAPANQGAPLARLARGDTVRMFAIAGDWASIAYRDGQCWILADHLSTERPI